eukprot:2900473-Rhodomonas_salina.1
MSHDWRYTVCLETGLAVATGVRDRKKQPLESRAGMLCLILFVRVSGYCHMPTASVEQHFRKHAPFPAN